MTDDLSIEKAIAVLEKAVRILKEVPEKDVPFFRAVQEGWKAALEQYKIEKDLVENPPVPIFNSVLKGRELGSKFVVIALARPLVGFIGEGER